MPGNSDMDAIIYLATDARKEDAWLEFSRYCERRGRGVRAAAMEHLENFLQAAVAWSFEKRLAFSRWVLCHRPKFSDDRVVLPNPLRTRLLIPTFRAWEEMSPGEAEAHLWLGILRCDDPSAHLGKALELDPSCELARETLTCWILSDIAYNQHELPSGYLGDPADDLRELDRASELLCASTVETWVSTVQKQIVHHRALAEDALAKKDRAGKVVP